MSTTTSEPWLPVPADPKPETIVEGACQRCGDELDAENYCSFCGEITRYSRRRAARRA